MQIIGLPYVKEQAEEYETRFGFIETSNLGLYKDVLLRSKVVIRVDVLFSMKKIFKENTIINYRILVYNLISGNNTDKNKISSVLLALCREDETFYKYISELYYFNFDLLKPNISFYDLVMLEISKEYMSKRDLQYSVIDYYKYTFIAEDKGYIYYAANDVNRPIFISRGMKGEQWSSAKNWTRKFQEC